jgi:cysteinyl-tRNA synthetase
LPIYLHNTLSRRKELFKPLRPDSVGLYVCGPTVYDLAHIGNARPVVVFDVLFRLLRLQFKNVVYVRNITDIDDKIIAAAAKNGESIEALTARTDKAFHEDMAALYALPPTAEPRATQHIDGMQRLITMLLEKGHAYVADGHVLFHVPSMPNYGRLSGHSREELIAGARVDVAPYKKDPADFVLWKPSTPEQPGWDSPWGRGRPGWHIECSAMSEAYLGETFDIHGGGIDLIFPHHENEIAQSECAHGKPFVRTWMHNGFLIVEGEKMSKSLGNFFTVRELLAKARGEAIRLTLLSAHYRQPLDFTLDGLEQSKHALDRLYIALRDAADVPSTISTRRWRSPTCTNWRPSSTRQRRQRIGRKRNRRCLRPDVCSVCCSTTPRSGSIKPSSPRWMPCWFKAKSTNAMKPARRAISPRPTASATSSPLKACCLRMDPPAPPGAARINFTTAKSCPLHCPR